MIFDFNRKLNAGEAHSDAYCHWQTYRDRISQYTLNHGNGHGTWLIVGAGNCNDIDLNRLAFNAEDILLTDADLHGMQEGCHRQGRILSMEQLDYLGLERTDFFVRLKQLMQGYTREKMSNFLFEMEKTIQDAKHPWVDRKFDHVLVLPIHTQLLFPQLDNILVGGLQEKLLTKSMYLDAQRMILDRMPNVLKNFNEILLMQLKDEGRLIVFSDFLEDVPEGAYSQRFDSIGFEDVYRQYEAVYGMGLGRFGLYDLESRCHILDSKWFLWPFDNNRNLFVKGSIFELC